MFRLRFYSRLLISLFLSSNFACAACTSKNSHNSAVVIEEKNVPYSVLGETINNRIVVVQDVDLEGASCELPDNYTLVINGSTISNGMLIGNNTKLQCGEKSFNRVSFLGSWEVPVIKTSMFVDLSYENALKDVIALTNPGSKNYVYIEEGAYLLSAKKNRDDCLTINSNTTLIIDGTLKLAPNNFRSYNILDVEGENINIRGKGSIIGDKDEHTGDSGEWGMGINVLGSHHVLIQDLTIMNCWGDCIYIGSESKNVIVENCTLYGSRRQGVSITSGSNIRIEGGVIRNIAGTSPECAIDVEPNVNETVDDVVIDGVKVENCRGGIKTDGQAPNTKLGKVIIKNCQIRDIMFHAPLWFKYTDYVEVSNCNISIDIIKFVFRFTGGKKGVIKGNQVYAKRFFMEPCPNVEITDNVIQCGGFFTEQPDEHTIKTVKVDDNTFLKRMPQLPRVAKGNKVIK